jgi:hypothetical protein
MYKKIIIFDKIIIMIMKTTMLIFFIATLSNYTYCQDIKDYKVGMQITPQDYSKVKKGLYENMNAIQINNKWGVVDRNYVLTTPIIYEEIYWFVKGVCKVKYEGKYGYINKNGSFIIQPKYDDIFGFTTYEEKIKYKSYDDEDITSYKILDKQGYIDINGKEITQPIFSSSSDLFSQGVATVMKNNKWGLIDKYGNFIVPCIYKKYRNYLFRGYNAIAFIDENGMCGFYNKDGKIIVPFSKKQIAEDYEIGRTSSADEVPPVFKINGKFELVKNIERLEQDYGLFMDENTINNKSFLSDYYKQKKNAITGKSSNTKIEITNNNENQGCETTILEYEKFAKEFIKYSNSAKAGTVKFNINEYVKWEKEIRKQNDNVMKCVTDSNRLRVLKTMEKVLVAVQSTYGNSGSTSSSSSSSTASNNSGTNNSKQSKSHTYKVIISWNNPVATNSHQAPSAQNGTVEYFSERSGSFQVKPICPICSKKQYNTISGFAAGKDSKIVTINCN